VGLVNNFYFTPEAGISQKASNQPCVCEYFFTRPFVGRTPSLITKAKRRITKAFVRAFLLQRNNGLVEARLRHASSPLLQQQNTRFSLLFACFRSIGASSE
jgi:hypothetical protein